jgi:hypothetical protein
MRIDFSGTQKEPHHFDIPVRNRSDEGDALVITGIDPIPFLDEHPEKYEVVTFGGMANKIVLPHAWIDCRMVDEHLNDRVVIGIHGLHKCLEIVG